MARSAAIVTVGSELTEGLRLDTNTQEVAFALSSAGFHVLETLSVGDDTDVLAEQLARMCARYELVLTTGGLGPTHDDITRDAASCALGKTLVRDDAIADRLRGVVARHRAARAAEQVLLQALVLEGADVIPATSGTAPGQIVETAAGHLVLLPGPPKEMRPMLASVLERFGGDRAGAVDLGVAGMTESDVQHVVQRVLGDSADIGFTVLAKPGDVHAILTDHGAGDEAMAVAARAVADALGDRCYSRDGRSMAQVIVAEAVARGVTISLAESCTGGMIAAALTDVAGSSAAFLGGVVSYSNAAKRDVLGVPWSVLEERGAVSRETVRAMAHGAARAFGSDVAVSVSGIAGPDGGTADKPVGTVWFAVRSADGAVTEVRRSLFGDREGVRIRATAYGLDLLRRALLGLAPGE